MIFTSPFIAALAVPVSGSRTQEGFGRIERRIDTATYVISMGREKMTVTVTQGALAVGQRVTVSARDEGLLITVVTPHAGEAAAMSKANDDVFQKSGAWFAGEEITPASLDAVIIALQACGPAGNVGRSEALFEALAPSLEAAAPELTRTIKRLFATIAAFPTGDPARAENVTVAIELLQRLKGELAGASVSQAKHFFMLQKTIPDGVYRFTEIEAVLAFLGVRDANGENDDHLRFAQKIAPRLAEYGAIVIRTITCGKEETAAVSLRPDEVSREFVSLSRHFTSRAFRSIPLPCFERLLDDRATVRFDTLRLLDGLAVTLHLPAATIRAGSREAQEAALVQWLHAALDGRCRATTPPVTLPTFSAASIIESLEELTSAPAGLLSASAIKLPSAHQVAVTMEAMTQTDGARVLGSVFRQMGCDLEHTLAQAEVVDRSSLKAQLLDLARNIGAPAYTDFDPVDNQKNKISAAVENALYMKVEEFERTCLSFIGRTFASGAQARHLEPTIDALRDREASIVAPESLETRIRRDISVLIQTRMAELKRLIGELPGETRESASPPAEGAASPVLAIARRIEALLFSLKNGIEELPRRFFPHPEPGAAPDGDGPAPGQPKPVPVFGTMFDALESRLSGLFQTFDEFRSSFVRILETAVFGLPREISMSDTKKDEKGRPEASPRQVHEVREGPDAEAPARGTMRRTVETLLNRVESLQLLARQVPTASGDQQIVALPVKIGNEWTEMHVRFVRHHGRKGGRESRTKYTVYIDVAPSLLGAISTRLEYHGKRNLIATMAFESDDTRWWFSSRKGDLCDALRSLGVPSPRVEFSKSSPRSGRADLETEGIAPGPTIDVQA